MSVNHQIHTLQANIQRQAALNCMDVEAQPLQWERILSVLKPAVLRGITCRQQARITSITS